jgi:UDP-N-acetylglucosamine 4,6-dehydratase
MNLNKELKNKKILIIGGSGSLGEMLISRYIADNEIFIMSRGETRQWQLANQFNKKNLKFLIGDVRDKTRIEEVLRTVNPQILICCYALKHIVNCETYVKESILTNTLGTLNVVEALNNVKTESLETVLFVSTDKAASPELSYGACKLLSERIITSQPLSRQDIKFVCVRYGNILMSNGSILPLFHHQAKNEKEFTLTHIETTRFLMTLNQSVDLINTAINHGATGDLWIPILPAFRIKDLAEIFSEKYKKPVNVIGLRKGEKIAETLVSEIESLRAKKLGTTHYVISPPTNPIYSTEFDTSSMFCYTSDDGIISKEQLKMYLENLEML